MKSVITETGRSKEQSLERINAFSDGIFAIWAWFFLACGCFLLYLRPEAPKI
jgi:uncharacterized membrane protein